MPLTRDFKDTIRARAQREAAFREALLAEAAQCLLSGEVETGKAVLRNYINATIGFESLGSEINKSPKSLMRMLGPAGNPRTENLCAILSHLQEREGVHLEVRAVR